MKNNEKKLVMLFASALLVLLFGCKPEVHNHTFTENWESDTDYHWHAATCEHSDEVSGKAAHTWDAGMVTKTATEESEGVKTYTCTVCKTTKNESIEKLLHTHKFLFSWTGDSNYHWHEATCGHPEVSGKAIHLWNEGVVKKEATLLQEGEKTVTCTVCGRTKTEIIEKIPYNWYESPVDFETGEAATTSSTYVLFGVFPKTILPLDSKVIVDETDTVIMGANTYYRGSDGEYYVKELLNTWNREEYSDGTQSSWDYNVYRYFKVAPIKWRVLETDYNGKGNALLLAEDVLMSSVAYYLDNMDSRDRIINGMVIYPNNYKHSSIRAYLNGLTYWGENSIISKFYEKGFLQSAFTIEAQSKIATTEVDNGGESTTDASGYFPKADGTSYVGSIDFTCETTEDKIFLLSVKEATTTAYGFANYNSNEQGNARIREATDYAKAKDVDTYSLRWYLRTPEWSYGTKVLYVLHDGTIPNDSGSNGAGIDYYGIVPALTISLR